MLTTLQRLMRNTDGATAIEYGFTCALIAIAIVTALNAVGSNLSTTFNTVAGKL
jgi:pilus assembly protein Flp/PilA